MMTSSAFGQIAGIDLNTEEGVAQKTLVIGDLDRWKSIGRNTAAFDKFHFTSFRELTEELLDQLSPTIILSALVADEFDVVEVAENLEKLGFDGLYRAITHDVPHADMIREEVRSHAPDLDFDILVIRTFANDG